MARTRSTERIGWLPASVTWIASTRPIPTGRSRSTAAAGGAISGSWVTVTAGSVAAASTIVHGTVADQPGILPSVSQPALAAPTGRPDPAGFARDPCSAAPDGPPPAVDDASDSLWSSHRRALTIGLVLNVTIVASEALAVSTIMPIVAKDLGGLDLYGWVFSAFFLGSLLGIVVAGIMIDRGGLTRPFLTGDRPVLARAC